jgi:hypothetical protein
VPDPRVLRDDVAAALLALAPEQRAVIVPALRPGLHSR